MDAMFGRWIFIGAATQSRAIMSQAHFSLSVNGLPLLHPFNCGWLTLVNNHWFLRSIDPLGHEEGLSWGGQTTNPNYSGPSTLTTFAASPVRLMRQWTAWHTPKGPVAIC